MFNKATKYLEKGNYAKAISFFKKQLADKEFKECYLNMGNAYKLLGNSSEAEKCYLKSASENVPFADGTYGNYALAYNNIGLLEYSSGNDSRAQAFYNAALTIDPLYYEAIWNYGNCLLRSTNCSSDLGWEMYEYRFKRATGAVKIDNSVSLWDGRSCGDSIVVQAEQGLGDKIMFGRYLSKLQKYFDLVVVMCHESLDCLYAPFPCVRSTSGFDLTIPMGSLPKIFGVVDENWLDGKFEAYDFGGEFNIGVVWSGSSTHANNSNRSCPSSYFSRLSRLGALYSLSPDAPDTRAIKALRPQTWAETASYILGLDLVVSVDTSVVHLAGTLGVPCIMIQPLRETDFRWGDGSAPNVWYKSVDIVPNNNNWDRAFAEVAKRIVCIKK